MKPKEFLAKMAQFDNPGVLTLSPGPFKIKVGNHDIRAAQFIDALSPDYEEQKLKTFEAVFLNGVLRQLHDLSDGGRITLSADLWDDDQIQTLLMAWWWVVFFAAQHGIGEEETAGESES